MQGLDRLATAVVAQAVRDYEISYKLWLRCGEKTRMMKELQLFFKSPWFGVFADADGETVMKLIEKKIENRRKK